MIGGNGLAVKVVDVLAGMVTGMVMLWPPHVSQRGQMVLATRRFLFDGSRRGEIDVPAVLLQLAVVIVAWLGVRAMIGACMAWVDRLPPKRG